ncbi:hypothetical protein CU021_0315 [Enterococcus faecium]|nr:hypothetical protein [Enterococcus faecium]
MTFDITYNLLKTSLKVKRYLTISPHKNVLVQLFGILF